MSQKSFYDFTAKTVLGNEDINFSSFHNKVVIVVNSASYCGFTKSAYSGLSTLLDRYYDQGLRVLLFPCNQFANQEKDDPETIQRFIRTFDERFIVAQKVNVNGSDAHPIFQWLKTKCPGLLFDAIKWNFTKFLINKEGTPVARYAPNDDPEKMEPQIKELLSQAEAK